MIFQLSSNRGTPINIKGAYVIVDNGYLDWSTTVPPFKDSINKSEVWFSQWLESLRRDVECTFGILKSRWRILKTGIRLHSTEAADNVWLTCCALHNMLLKVEGLRKGLENGIPSFWMSDRNGDLDFEDLPQGIRRLNAGCSQDFIDRCRSVDTMTRFGSEWQPQRKNRNDVISVNERPLTEGEIVSINELPLKQFRSMLLVEHFNCQYVQSKIVWPKMLVVRPRHVPN